MTGIGAVAVRCPRVRDRVGEGGEHIRFSSTILPPYARRSKSLEVLIPILYLKGISTGDFEEALIAGATPEGKKELVGLIDGVRESAQSWKELLLDLKNLEGLVKLGAKTAIGAIGDIPFLTETFKRADGVYVMLPPM
jgi:putative transposase